MFTWPQGVPSWAGVRESLPWRCRCRRQTHTRARALVFDLVSVSSCSRVAPQVGAIRVTAEHLESEKPVSLITGGRRYAFANDAGALCLFQYMRVDSGRHDYVGSCARKRFGIISRCSLFWGSGARALPASCAL